MKKYIFLLVTIIFIGTNINYEVNASADNHREIRNILDLSALDFDFDTETYYSKDYIYVKKDTEYTLLADPAFIGDNELMFYIEYEGEEQLISFEACDDLYYFITFTTKADKFKIKEFKFSGKTSYNVMLYEGDQNKFEDQYIPYTPYDNFSSGVLIVDYDEPLTVAKIDSYIKAYNNTTNESVEVIKSTNRYKHEIGSTYAKYYAYVNKVQSVYYLAIQVVDLTAPVIVTETLDYSYKTPPSIDEIIDDIKITDNVNKRDELQVIEIVDNYSDNIKPGESEVIITVSDKANNTTRKAVKINLIDNIPPVISYPEAIFVYSTDEPLSDLEIKDRIKATDEITGLDKIKVEITQNEYLQTKVPGSYPVLITATDLSGNETSIEIIIHVIENEMAFFKVDKVIETNSSLMITEDEIIDTFIKEAKLKGIDVNRENIVIDKTIYDLNYNKPGEYTAYIEYLTNDENLNHSEITILVNKLESKFNYLYLAPLIVVLIPSTLIILKKKKRRLN